MRQTLIYLCLFGCFLHDLMEASEFSLDGDYLLGGLFEIHLVDENPYHDRPVMIKCSSMNLTLSSYRRFQVMRFSVEEINNSTNLLPNVKLGYELFDLCSDTQNFPSVFSLISVDGTYNPWDESPKSASKMVAVVGTYLSTSTLSVAPLFMMDLIPMIGYGASSSFLSEKRMFPSFLRTSHSNKDVIDAVVKILLEFDWSWVSFLYVDDDYGRDGRDLFITKIMDTQICLAYSRGLTVDTNYGQIFSQIKALGTNVIIVYAAEWTAEALIEAAIKLNVNNKVWVAPDGWSLDKKLPTEPGIKNIGTVIGVADPALTIPGFSDFIYSSKAQSHENPNQETFCNQNCNCSDVTAEDIINADPSFNFPVYAAVYAIAHALHNVLQCGAGSCNTGVTPQPQMVLEQLRDSNFTLLNQTVQFDQNGDPKFGHYSVVYWNQAGDAEVVGFCQFQPPYQFVINKDKIKWDQDTNVPVSICSEECSEGFKKTQQGIHKCCFNCTKCPIDTYINSTEDPYKCKNCTESAWSEEGSTSCNQRQEELVPFSDSGAILIVIFTLVFLGLSIAVSVLFAINYNTPVVKSAGGPMCFLILVCLSLCSVGVFFFFDEPTMASCVLRFLPSLLFFTVSLACFVVRSFQIVCIFKIATKFPKLLSWWVKYNGQCFIVAVAFVTQGILLIIGYSTAPPKPLKNPLYPDRIIFGCDYNNNTVLGSVIFLSLLCILCFIFSYMGKDLPKNYNEAKAITFCLLLLILTWVVFATIKVLYHGKYIPLLNALAVLFSLYSLLLWYFLPKCYIIIFQPNKNTQQHFQYLIHGYTQTVSQ